MSFLAVALSSLVMVGTYLYTIRNDEKAFGCFLDGFLDGFKLVGYMTLFGKVFDKTLKRVQKIASFVLGGTLAYAGSMSLLPNIDRCSGEE